MAHYFTQSELERAVGGAKRLRELLKKPGSATADADGVESVLQQVDGEIRQCVGMSYDLDSFDALWFGRAVGEAPAPSRAMTDMDRASIVVHGKACLRYYAWLEGEENQAIPESVAKGYERAKDGLKEIGARMKVTGSKPVPSSSRNFQFRQPRGVGDYRAGTQRARFRGLA